LRKKSDLAAEALEYLRQKCAHAVHGGFVVAGRFNLHHPPEQRHHFSFVLLAEGKMGGYGLAVGFGCHIGMINGLLRSVSSVQIIGKNLLSGLFQLGPATRFSRGWAEVIPDWRGFQLSFLSVSSVFISGEVFVFPIPAISGDLYTVPLAFQSRRSLAIPGDHDNFLHPGPCPLCTPNSTQGHPMSPKAERIGRGSQA
jgi:hypothetical protein